MRIYTDLPWESAMLMIAKLLFAVSVASLSWYLFEKPILRLKDRFTSSRHPAEAARRLPWPRPSIAST